MHVHLEAASNMASYMERMHGAQLIEINILFFFFFFILKKKKRI